MSEIISTDLEQALATFFARSSKRNAAIDEARISSIEESIDAVVSGLIAERTGLVKRVKRILDEPEALARWNSTSKAKLSDSEFVRVEERLQLLDQQILECGRLRQAVGNLRTLTDPRRIKSK